MDDLEYRFTGVVKFHPSRLQFVIEDDSTGELFSFDKMLDVIVTGNIFDNN